MDNTVGKQTMGGGGGGLMGLENNFIIKYTFTSHTYSLSCRNGLGRVKCVSELVYTYVYDLLFV